MSFTKTPSFLACRSRLPVRRLALGDRGPLTDPVGGRSRGEFGELDAAVGRQRHLPRPGRGEHLHAPLQVDQFAEQRQRHHRPAGGVDERAQCLRSEARSARDPVGLLRVELVGVHRHLLVQLVAEPAALRLEGRQVRRCERHEERLLPVVGHEAVARVEVAELLVAVNLLLGLVGADVAERERRGLQHRVPGGVLAHRAGRHPRHAPFDARRLLDSRGGLLLDERDQLVARLELVGRCCVVDMEHLFSGNGKQGTGNRSRGR